MNGSLGLESVRAHKFLDRGSLYGSIGPSISWPIFQGGNLYANLKAEEAAMDEAAYNYEYTLQKAFGDVRTAYSAYTQEYHRYESLKGAVKAAKDAENKAQQILAGIAEAHTAADAALKHGGGPAHIEGDHALVRIPDVHHPIQFFFRGGQRVSAQQVVPVGL